MAARSNAFNHYTITLDDGTTWNDKCRNSMGGYVNLIKRIAERLSPQSIIRITAADGSTNADFVDEHTGITGTIR
jgi:hypothetical protein